MIDWLVVISLLLHLIATAFWIGGLFILSVLVWPQARQVLTKHVEQGQALLDFLDRFRKRFYPLTTLSLIVLVVTGLLQMSHDPNYEGFLQFTNSWSWAMLAKHLAIVGMVIAGGIMQWGILPQLERSQMITRQGKRLPNAPDAEMLRQRERQLTWINCGLGLLVLLFTAIATSI